MGVIVPGITNLFFPTIVEEINKILVDNGFIISLFSTEGDPEIEKKVIESIIPRNMDGIIAIDPSLENLENGYFPSLCKTIPTIIINADTGRHNCNFISYDEKVGTREAFQHLLNLGHRKISFLRGDRSLSYDLKEDFYRQLIRENGLKYEKVIIVGRGNSQEVVEKTSIIYGKHLDFDERETAVFACNDLMAVGVINACNRNNIVVPDDMSVIGFDNTLLSSVNHPKITTVDLKMKEIGKVAATELIDMTKNKSTVTRKIVYDTKLVIRESCSGRED